jgi:hypothetical protein
VRNEFNDVASNAHQSLHPPTPDQPPARARHPSTACWAAAPRKPVLWRHLPWHAPPASADCISSASGARPPASPPSAAAPPASVTPASLLGAGLRDASWRIPGLPRIPTQRLALALALSLAMALACLTQSRRIPAAAAAAAAAARTSTSPFTSTSTSTSTEACPLARSSLQSPLSSSLCSPSVTSVLTFNLGTPKRGASVCLKPGRNYRTTALPHLCAELPVLA